MAFFTIHWTLRGMVEVNIDAISVEQAKKLLKRDLDYELEFRIDEEIVPKKDIYNDKLTIDKVERGEIHF